MEILLIVVTLLFLLYLFFQENQKNKKIKYKNKLDRSLDQQLLIMLGGDRQAVLRLLRNARKNHPGKSYLWYHEKVIRDIERDRRY